MSILKQLREDRGRKPSDLAAAAGISVPAYYDLETNEGDFDDSISMESVVRLAKELGVKPSAFYGASPRGVVSTDELAVRVREHLERTDDSLANFEEKIGWSIGDALASPARFREFNADGLRAVCDPIGINWLGVLDGLS